ncbi:UDP-3-O-acyl-N-acetylglucosamine deacetylase [Thermosynechococcus vestitus]|uniref:UDP-3-O-acyl-N-acetylglucosamine deacetylase n=1 Tax=Thermosynechococcus vestitus (strain NIES-2133 / IAM M-273 / BP-1) TaxID=197221 RepID=LPXC_THEVB|nr:UDP-3-O-acyl-N-acetylglucosamine deacetylase [Thermosynechococcus vestitus]Q8DI02.1 RecName: Full=UDP-3-O-acyl-N-acetylglucosamine deacetylase; Short=UDP-3-O-acyl-GlcNAc deacetylase; AltName: Full=UDP-3-O-[R-3-hydroxymyristoyl]-N-acetylglucosamine deacetylase [Thermosynechococcus vestitus BP-1]BAC09342.1 UDP-3-O-acyl N-acetylglcosamine deacetylase [Thermosynechococcus vestitus BP-1]
MIAASGPTPLVATTQRTLAGTAQWSGVGLHSGQWVALTLQPAAANTGRQFVRLDLEGQPVIPARIEAVKSTQLATELVANGASVRTVEHLLAALAIAGIDNVTIQITGPEVPVLDGSAQPWLEGIQRVGVVPQEAPRPAVILKEPVTIYEGEAFVSAIPAPELRLTYGIDFPYRAIGRQWCSFTPSELATEVAPARTFGFAEQVDYLRSQGLIQGGSLENALVCSASGWVNPPLRFADEPVRHKLLDLWGDLALLGTPPIAHYVAYRASHHLHTQLARAIAQQRV